MPIKANLNTSPYYDDFNDDTSDANYKEFYRVLFRPGMAIQARELTTLQTYLQNQVEKFGMHMFEEGAMVIPGQIALDTQYEAVKIQNTFVQTTSTSYTTETYREDYVGKVITGVGFTDPNNSVSSVAPSGVKAKVIASIQASSTDPLTLYVKYESSGTDNSTKVFANGENIAASDEVGSFAADIDSATLETTDACPTGASVNIGEGVYFTRGHFVKNIEQTLILDKYTNTPSYRIGFDITESFQTPEGDTSLLDNASGTSNYSAKGAHRLVINLKLAKRAVTSVDDSDFIELMRVENGVILSKVQHTDYSLIEKTLARRTYDESGDYTVEDFNIEPREHLLDGTNLGIYLSSSGGDSTKIALGLSPGKAYVRGYEIETLSTQYVNLDKARDVSEVNNSVAPASLGNYILVDNVFGTPDITTGTNSDPFGEIQFYDEKNTTAGSTHAGTVVNGTQIGQARCRAFEHHSGALANRQAVPQHGAPGGHGSFKLFLFDVQMFVLINVTGTPTYGIGAKITGASSGAYGYVSSAVSGPQFNLVQVSGSFIANETLTSSINGNTQTATIIDTTVYDLSKVKQVFGDQAVAGEDFIADVVLDSDYTLQGTLTTVAGSASVTGLNTFFSSELRVGDIISIPSGANGDLEERAVFTIPSNTALTLTASVLNAVSSTVVRKRTSMKEQEELVAVYKLPKSNVKTLQTTSNNFSSVSSLKIRRQFQTQVNGGIATFNCLAGETFLSYSNSDYSLSMLDPGTTGGGTGTGNTGDVVDISGLSGGGSSNIVITNPSVFGSAAGGPTVKFTATVHRSAGDAKPKVAHKSQKKTISAVTSSNNIYGQRISDVDISLGFADVYAIRGIYISKDTSTVPDVPILTLDHITVDATSTFIPGDKIRGVTSGAIGGIIGYTSSGGVGTLEYYVISGTFSGTEDITYISGITTWTATVTGTIDGSRNITSDFTLDTGQRDSYYDISRIVRKASSVAPTAQVLIVYDYFSHGGSGDYFSVDSYLNQVDYSDIPQYIATRVDPDTLAPSGEYELRDCLDFRPRVSDGSANNNFVFDNRSFKATGSARYDIPKVDSLVESDFEFYLNRIDDLYLSSGGSFVIQKGNSDEDPDGPDGIEDAMKLGTIYVPAYTHKSSDILIERVDNSRYTMRDIGKLEKRIANLEYYTSLNMLEADTQSLQIQDANGLDRFKAGFIVDNFSGHGIGDVLHRDYACSIDMQQGYLRPESYQDNIELKEWASTDTARNSLNYSKVGDLLMLPYSHAVMVSQGFASRVENVNPFAIQTWIGVIKLSPSSDTWVDTRRAPDIVLDLEGNYESVRARERDRLGTIWNSWRTLWTGTSVTRGGRRNVRTRRFGRGLDVVQRTTTTTTQRQHRTGVHTRLIETREKRFAGKRIIDSSVISWMRHKRVTFNATGLKPNTKLYPFFDGVDVSVHVTNPLVTDSAGKLVNKVFEIPGFCNHCRPTGRGSSFRTGKRTFRLTDRSDNDMTPGIVNTSGEATYEASGTLNTEQSTFHSLRNAEVVRTTLTDQRSITSTRTEDRVVGWWDPLAQTFLVENKGGAFITKVDLYFQAKDATLPVTVMIRTVENGNPAKLILPFSTVAIEPADVNISDDGSLATTITFDSPVYLKHMEEYCLVVQTSSNDYKVWISQVGEKEIASTRTISEQPYMGVLFKSQNSSTWTASQMQDLKFTMYKAKFDTSVTSNVKLINEEISTENTEFSSHDMFTLGENPISTEAGVAKVRIYHPNHGMHSTSSNVTISGVIAPTGETDKLAIIPLSQINKDHTAISDIEVDSYCVSTSTVASVSISAGGIAVLATRDLPFDVIHPVVAVMDFPDVTISANIQTTSAQSLAGSETAYSKISEAVAPSVTLNENYKFTTPRLVASKKNETANLSGSNSLDLNIKLSTTNENISPVIDLERSSIITVSNRIDKIDSASDIGTAHTYISSTEAEGDNNPAIYMTRKISLEVPATALRTMLAASVQSSAGIEVYYKILRTDVNTNFDDISWVPYNTNGIADLIPSTSKDDTDFKDYLYTVDSLPDFIAFAIKIVMKSTNSTQVPLIKDFRTISLAL